MKKLALIFAILLIVLSLGCISNSKDSETIYVEVEEIGIACPVNQSVAKVMIKTHNSFKPTEEMFITSSWRYEDENKWYRFSTGVDIIEVKRKNVYEEPMIEILVGGTSKRNSGFYIQEPVIYTVPGEFSDDEHPIVFEVPVTKRSDSIEIEFLTYSYGKDLILHEGYGHDDFRMYIYSSPEDTVFGGQDRLESSVMAISFDPKVIRSVELFYKDSKEWGFESLQKTGEIPYYTFDIHKDNFRVQAFSIPIIQDRPISSYLIITKVLDGIDNDINETSIKLDFFTHAYYISDNTNEIEYGAVDRNHKIVIENSPSFKYDFLVKQ